MKKLYEKYKELIHYLFFGGATTAVNWVVYGLLVELMGADITLSNALAWAAAVLFAFVTNKLFVFESKSFAPKVIFPEMATFLGSRVFSGLLEIWCPKLLMNAGLDQPLFGIDGFAAKLVVSIGVIVLNFVLSKLLVFRKK